MRFFFMVIQMVLFSHFFTGCMRSLPSGPVIGARTYKQKMDMRFNLLRRTYHVHIPPAYDKSAPLPLVVVIHGAFDTADGMETFTGFSAIADRENFIVIYPNGISLFGFLQHWNAGHCCGKAHSDNVDDVGFIAATIEDACSRLSIDRRRIYVTGFSNGGMMAYRFAAERSDMIAAAAPLAASIGGSPSPDMPEWHISAPEYPVPLLTMHGMADEDIPFEGGISPRRQGTRTYWSVAKSVEFWVKYNQCGQHPQTATLHDGVVHVTSWQDCSGESVVLLYTIQNWGHVWPGRYFTGALAPNHPLHNFDAAEIIWDFFKLHAKK